MYQMHTDIRIPMGFLPKVSEAIGDFACAYVAEDFGDLIPYWDVLVANERVRAVIDGEGLLSIHVELRQVDSWLDDARDLARALAPFVAGPAVIKVFAEDGQTPVAILPLPNGAPFPMQ